MITPEQILPRRRPQIMDDEDRQDEIALEAFLREQRRQSDFMARLAELIGSIGRKSHA